MDSAFFSEAIIETLDTAGLEFTASVPFAHFTALKGMLESRRRWRRIDHELSYFESQWRPNCWHQRFRFLFIRKRARRQCPEPVQLDLFTPHEYGYDFNVIVTNKSPSVGKVVAFQEGRGAQEGVFGELKHDCHMDHIPVITRVGNQLYLLAAILAHNLAREMQMRSHPPQRATTGKRTALWAFQQLDTLRRNLIQRAGRLIRPNGNVVLSMNTAPAVEKEMLHYHDALQCA